MNSLRTSALEAPERESRVSRGINVIKNNHASHRSSFVSPREMTEGWVGDDYLIVFSASESIDATERYGIAEGLPGYTVVGLRGWDDFIVTDSSGRHYTVPTVPLDPKYLTPFDLPNTTPQPDPRLAGKVKWYVKPLVFGGDPKASDNLTWVSHEEHVQLVVFWNEQYRSLTAHKPTT